MLRYCCKFNAKPTAAPSRDLILNKLKQTATTTPTVLPTLPFFSRHVAKPSVKYCFGRTKSNTNNGAISLANNIANIMPLRKRGNYNEPKHCHKPMKKPYSHLALGYKWRWHWFSGHEKHTTCQAPINEVPDRRHSVYLSSASVAKKFKPVTKKCHTNFATHLIQFRHRDAQVQIIK